MSRIFESPFLDSELFVAEPDHGTDRRTEALVASSPFLDTFSTEDVISASEREADTSPVSNESSYEFVEEHAGPDDESYDRTGHESDAEMLFEQFVPVVSASDLRTRIDDFLAAGEPTYTLPGSTVAKAPATFRYAKSGEIEKLATKLSKTLGNAFERKNPGAIHFAVYGRPRLEHVSALTQALIDKGEFEKVTKANPGLTNVQAIRRMQRDFGIGIDCAGYVQLSFINAFMGKDDDSPAVRRSLGLQERRGYERLSDLPLTHFQKFTDVTQAQTGDLLILAPKGGDWHTVIIVDRTNVGSVHSFLCDASWGRDLYGDDNAGIQRRELMFDTDTGEWWDIEPGTANEAHRNDIGPYNGHRVHGVYRPRTSAAAKVKPAPKTTPELELDEERGLDEETGPHPDCSKSGHGIHGDDDRRKVANPLEVPCRWICHIWARRTDSDGNVTVTGGTGVLISPRHVLTVAHLLCDSVRKDGRVITYDATSVRVTPARSGDDRPFGTHAAKLPARIAKGWTARGMAAPYDYALLTLEKPIGNEEFERLGGRKLCYWGSRACGEGTSVRAVAPRALEGRTAITAGYPKDRGGGIVPHITSGQLSNVKDMPPLMDFSADACQGQSGSPVWVNVDGKHCLVGIMRSVGETTNTALRISEAMCIQLRKWMGNESDACSSSTPTPAHEYAEDETDEVEDESLLDVELEEPDAYELDEPEGELIADLQEAGEEEVTCRCREAPVEQEARRFDPALADLAERIARRRELELEFDTPPKFVRCFSSADIDKVRKVYEDNTTAASSDSSDRCSCIVMLNVAMGALLKVKTKKSPARSKSDRDVDMASLPTESIEKSMQALVRAGKAKAPIVMNFQDSRGRTAGTFKPVKLKASVQARILKEASKKGCWFAFGLSVMDGYHSVLLLVDRSGASATIYWLDQFSTGVDDDVTTTLDDRLTSMTQGFWQSVQDTKSVGSDTMVRIWALGMRK